ncbi:MAG TPA: phage holin family protein [Euzebyales bacterium]|nr:phage holin family protein [Euzebyales bacterium]
MGLIVKLLVTAAGVWLAVQLVDGLDYRDGWVGLLLIALILAAVNALARPIVTLFSLPLVLLTLGFFLLVINALMFGLTIWISGQLGLGLTSSGFWATFIGALIVTVVSWIGEALLGGD